MDFRNRKKKVPSHEKHWRSEESVEQDSVSLDHYSTMSDNKKSTERARSRSWKFNRIYSQNKARRSTRDDDESYIIENKNENYRNSSEKKGRGGYQNTLRNDFSTDSYENVEQPAETTKNTRVLNEASGDVSPRLSAFQRFMHYVVDDSCCGQEPNDELSRLVEENYQMQVEGNNQETRSIGFSEKNLSNRDKDRSKRSSIKVRPSQHTEIRSYTKGDLPPEEEEYRRKARRKIFKAANNSFEDEERESLPQVGCKGLKEEHESIEEEEREYPRQSSSKTYKTRGFFGLTRKPLHGSNIKGREPEILDEAIQTSNTSKPPSGYSSGKAREERINELVEFLSESTSYMQSEEKSDNSSFIIPSKSKNIGRSSLPLIDYSDGELKENKNRQEENHQIISTPVKSNKGAYFRSQDKKQSNKKRDERPPGEKSQLNSPITVTSNKSFFNYSQETKQAKKKREDNDRLFSNSRRSNACPAPRPVVYYKS
mmetsp:Transcript_15402/g.21945  ORF Transcript_15402/g.21945 Transcript_15402/m.21945 type:complete len:484 (-) Transcript_15402:54-1505(-)